MSGKKLDVAQMNEDLQYHRELNASQREADADLFLDLMDVSSWWTGRSAKAMEAWAKRKYEEVTAIRDQKDRDIELTQQYLDRVVEKDRQYANKLAAFGSGNSIGTGVGSVAQQTSQGMNSLEFKEWVSKVTGVSADTNSLTEHFSKLGYGLDEVYWIYEGLKKNGVTAEDIGALQEIGYSFDDVVKDYSKITKITDKKIYSYMLKGGDYFDEIESRNPGSWKGMLTDVTADGSLSDTTKIKLIDVTEGEVNSLVQKNQCTSPEISVTSEYGSDADPESKVELAVAGMAVSAAGGNGLKNGLYIENGKKVYYKDDEIIDPLAQAGYDGMKSGWTTENGKPVLYKDDEASYYQSYMVNEMLTSGISIDEMRKDPGIKLVFSAVGETGVTEEIVNGAGNNKVKYNDWFWGDGKGDGLAWCAAFVMWNAARTGINNDINYPKDTDGMAGVVNVKNWFESKNKYYGKSSDYIPKTGDAFININSDGKTGHIGLVYAYDEEKDIVYTVEGNAGPKQGTKVVTSARTRNTITGFGSVGGEYSLPVPDDDFLTYGLNVIQGTR